MDLGLVFIVWNRGINNDKIRIRKGAGFAANEVTSLKCRRLLLWSPFLALFL